MACREGVDPADFESGSGDDSSDPVGSQLIVLDATADIVDADGHVYVTFIIGVDNINFTNDITFTYSTTDDTAVSSGANRNFQAAQPSTGTIKAGFASTAVGISVFVAPPGGGARYTGKPKFTLNISSPTNATILDGIGTGTIDYSLLADGVNPPSAPGLVIQTQSAQGQEGAQFVLQVTLTPASGSTVTVHYATANGSAIAGTDYTSASGTLTFNPGDTIKYAYVTALTPGANTDRTLTVNLSSPSGASIVVGSVTLTIQKPSSGGGLPDQFTGWDDNDRVTYDEFRTNGGGGCCFQFACTGFAGAALMSALAAFQGKGRWRFNAEKLYTDACCAGCTSATTNCQQCAGGCNPAKVPNWLTSTGAQRIDKNVVNNGTNANYTCKYRDVSADHAMFKAQSTAISAGNKSDLVTSLKQAIKNNGALYYASIFYHDWNTCASTDGYTLRPHGSDTSSIAHAWVMLGWDDNHLIPANADSSFGSLRGKRVGCFRIQSSHGCNRWGDQGRGWIPYSYLALPSAFSGNGVRYKYWKLTWVG